MVRHDAARCPSTCSPACRARTLPALPAGLTVAPDRRCSRGATRPGDLRPDARVGPRMVGGAGPRAVRAVRRRRARRLWLHAGVGRLGPFVVRRSEHLLPFVGQLMAEVPDVEAWMINVPGQANETVRGAAARGHAPRGSAGDLLRQRSAHRSQPLPAGLLRAALEPIGEHPRPRLPSRQSPEVSSRTYVRSIPLPPTPRHCPRLHAGTRTTSTRRIAQRSRYSTLIAIFLVVAIGGAALFVSGFALGRLAGATPGHHRATTRSSSGRSGTPTTTSARTTSARSTSTCSSRAPSAACSTRSRDPFSPVPDRGGVPHHAGRLVRRVHRRRRPGGHASTTRASRATRSPTRASCRSRTSCAIRPRRRPASRTTT